MLWLFLSQENCVLFLRLLETVPWCVLQKVLSAQLCVAKADFVFDASMLYVCANAGRCYLTNQLLLGQTVLVSALVLLCEERFLSCMALNVYEVVLVLCLSRSWLFYMMSSDFTFLFWDHIT